MGTIWSYAKEILCTSEAPETTLLIKGSFSTNFIKPSKIQSTILDSFAF